MRARVRSTEESLVFEDPFGIEDIELNRQAISSIHAYPHEWLSEAP